MNAVEEAEGDETLESSKEGNEESREGDVTESEDSSASEESGIDKNVEMGKESEDEEDEVSDESDEDEESEEDEEDEESDESDEDEDSEESEESEEKEKEEENTEDEISEEIAKELASVEVQGSKVTEEVIQKTVNTEESILGTEEGVGKVIIASGSEESDEANATLSNGPVSTNDRVKVEAGEPLDRSSESDERIEEGSIKSEESMMTVEATFAGDAGEAPEEVEEDIIVPVDAAITGPGGESKMAT